MTTLSTAVSVEDANAVSPEYVTTSECEPTTSDFDNAMLALPADSLPEPTSTLP